MASDGTSSPMDYAARLNGIYRRTGDSVEIINPVPYAKEAMIERLFPLVYSNALTATNLKLHHEWKRINKS